MHIGPGIQQQLHIGLGAGTQGRKQGRFAQPVFHFSGKAPFEQRSQPAAVMQDGSQVHGGVPRIAQPCGVRAQIQQALEGAAVAFHHRHVQRRHGPDVAAIEARAFGQQLARLRQVAPGRRLVQRRVFGRCEFSVAHVRVWLTAGRDGQHGQRGQKQPAFAHHVLCER